MTSAATYKESKAESEKKASASIRRLPIQDLLAQESKEASPVNKPVVDDIADFPHVEETPVGESALHEDIPIKDAPLAELASIIEKPIHFGQSTPARASKRSFDEVFSDTEASTAVMQAPLLPPVLRRAILQRERLANGSVALRVIRSNVSAVSTGGEANPKMAGEAKTATGPAAQGPPEPLDNPVAVHHNNVRPSKRRRIVAQVAACAFGTVLGGAAVLAGMIATAPPI
jgi:hypothetical protein